MYGKYIHECYTWKMFYSREYCKNLYNLKNESYKHRKTSEEMQEICAGDGTHCEPDKSNAYSHTIFVEEKK